MMSFPVEMKKTIEGYVAQNCEVTSSISFQYIPKISFCDGEVGHDSSDVNAICSRPEVLDDIIYGEDVETFMHYPDVNLRDASNSSFRENRHQPIV